MKLLSDFQAIAFGFDHFDDRFDMTFSALKPIDHVRMCAVDHLHYPSPGIGLLKAVMLKGKNTASYLLAVFLLAVEPS
jgi:hypothetical protein